MDIEGGKPSTSKGTSSKAKEHAPAPQHQPRDCFLAFCRGVNAVTALSALLCGVAHAMAVSTGLAVAAQMGSSPPALTLMQVLRLYAIGVAVLCMLLESEWECVMRGAGRVMESWVGRALVQGLLAVMTLCVARSDAGLVISAGHGDAAAAVLCSTAVRAGVAVGETLQASGPLHPHEAPYGGPTDFARSLHVYRQVAGYSMLGCAGFYLTAGALCVGALKQARYKWHAERARAERELVALDAARAELASALAAYSKE
uniref:Uncharacterized protein n=1 Tax=Chlamydomonas leiostraca TaxID=1034604 RepID=A0A7S0WWK7_9CHLO|mmetsp:Transcript_32699/g.82964  ORF Transcript_32699/g.82964 Transcript_32699/m.82964 type:complete len:258 (+) Transcript_32699:194-967(+)|eukprot:CAMPEP_0202868436 /NCGR_PEP_ID=MMETSP1391-20130828/10879_1 /ASSEMBLY_ACC=CAM_ASM_000867 /TAXON_ID=1034604 /ORGANISM="Chlamydomonas leiostraca, Strain SAG 11-49" /LENGTH=257 /DNA_ID=CAMNT_0049548611 /DNA_START=189 /DNA_END=962 /DNA_ORIENTATION=+